MLQPSLGSAALVERRQPFYFLSALVVPTTVVLGLVYVVLLSGHDRTPFRVIPVILLVLSHEFVVSLLLLNLPLGHNVDEFLFELGFCLVDSFYRLVDGCHHILVLF